MDPISNLISAAHTAFVGGVECFEISWSKFLVKVIDILCDRGYFMRYELRYYDREFPRIRIFLNRDLQNLHFKKISKPSLRIYMGYRDILRKYKYIPFVLVSTPLGLLDYNGVLINKQGGEILFVSLYQ